MKKITSFALVLAVFVSTFGTSLFTAQAAGPIGPAPIPTPTLSEKVIMLGGRINTPNNAYDGNDVWQTTNNGSNWTQLTSNAQWAGRSGHGALYFNGAIYVISGGQNDVWKSSNGVTWTQINPSLPFANRNLFASYVFNNKMWIVGGQGLNTSNFYNDVWSSTDGVTWIQETANTAFTPRYGMGYVVFNNTLWIFGGKTGSNANPVLKNDVWKSTNGITWTQVTSNAPWTPRFGGSSTVFQNKIWMLGGDTGTSFSNQRWYSTNGTQWYQALSSTSSMWAPRSNASSYVLNGALFTIAGGTAYGVSVLANDVWKSTTGGTWNQVTQNAPWAAREGQAVVVVPGNFGVNVPPPCTPSIHVVSPNGGEVYTEGDQITVNWTSTCLPTTANLEVTIGTLNGSGSSAVINSPNDGVEIFSTTGWLPSTNYIAKVKYTYPGTTNYLVDWSDNPFTINAPCTPSLILNSPNGGIYHVGDAISYEWTSCGVSSTASIQMLVSSSTGFNSGEVFFSQNDGVQSFTIPAFYQADDYVTSICVNDINFPGPSECPTQISNAGSFSVVL